eukprot:SAG31_NODE_17734_length_659_cov_1.533929_1_plen_159_part_10
MSQPSPQPNAQKEPDTRGDAPGLTSTAAEVIGAHHVEDEAQRLLRDTVDSFDDVAADFEVCRDAPQKKDVPTGLRARRWQMCALLCTAWVVAYSDRTNISLAIVPMERQFGYSNTMDGLVLSAFFAGYLATSSHPKARKVDRSLDQTMSDNNKHVWHND